MIHRFTPGGLIVVPAEVEGPTGAGIFRLAVDTGATRTLINSTLLAAFGYDLALAPARVEMTTASGVEFVPLLPIVKPTSLGTIRRDLAVIAHTLPPSAGIDGLLGLDFFRDGTLTIRFAEGELELND